MGGGVLRACYRYDRADPRALVRSELPNPSSPSSNLAAGGCQCRGRVRYDQGYVRSALRELAVEVAVSS
eukprot:4493564-Pyramimonas_sp.AAC.2